MPVRITLFRECVLGGGGAAGWGGVEDRGRGVTVDAGG